MIKETKVSRLLLNEPPLIVLPQLAIKIGLNEAIALQQVHYWIKGYEIAKSERHYQRGRYWVFNSYNQWKTDNFPFWSEATIRRTFSELEKKKLILTGTFSKDNRDKTKWYTIDYDEVLILEQKRVKQNPQTQSQSSDSPSAQIEQSICSDCTDHLSKLSSPNNAMEHHATPDVANASRDGANIASSETTSETTSEIKSLVPVSSKVNSLDTLDRESKKNDNDNIEEEIFGSDFKTINNPGSQQDADSEPVKDKEQTPPKEIGNEYFLSIEECLSKKTDIHVPLAYKNFAIVKKMFEGGVPLELVVKTIIEVMSRAKGNKIVSFKYFEDAIWENFNRKKSNKNTSQMTDHMLEQRKLARGAK
ncbi:hypothetical protein LCGC14_0548690 [marine sediment metagenome]|uniref:DnaD domain-containing protein n=1 Tax=marine sediment metagenome TaxID=412755 RepID=A0A0F9RVG4_9ZZZZ